jgi:hypothetical protein
MRVLILVGMASIAYLILSIANLTAAMLRMFANRVTHAISSHAQLYGL